jgi:hypothetical protein
VIAYQNDRTNIDLIKATYVLLNIGLVPLLTAFNRMSAMVSVIPRDSYVFLLTHMPAQLDCQLPRRRSPQEN